ncbi:MAG: MFS transporter [Candidatus Thermoplasmatota archaeon]|nr:MFS transporter [Candidatus Thermoplasmatota archaeon]
MVFEEIAPTRVADMMTEQSHETAVAPYRWVVLTLFVIVALTSQLLWLTFAPISSEMTDLYGVSAFDISLLSLVWPLVFVFLAIPVGIFIDKKGFEISVGTGALFLAVFAVLRVFSVYFDYNFTLLLISQGGAAFSQPFIFGSITKMAASWFPENEHGLATGLGTIGLFLGMMLALALTPFMFQSLGITGMLFAYALISCLATSLFLIFGKEGHLPSSSDDSAAFTLRDMRELSKFRGFFVLEYGFFAVVGGFTAIMTWLEEILSSLHGLTIDEAGLVGGLMIVGGIIGSVILPAISDKTKTSKPFVLLNLAVGITLLFLLGIISGFVALAVVFFIAGFFLMSALPLVLGISSRISGTGMEGRASSLLWFFSQVGSVILIAVVEPIQSLTGNYYHSIVVIAILWIVAFFLFTSIKENN